MKKIVLSSLLVATFSFSYEGCGTTKNDALDSLSKSIYVNIKNKLNKKESLDKSFFTTFFSKKIENQSSQTSSVILKNVTFSNKNGEVCAFVSQKDVENSAYTALEELKNCKLSHLPTTIIDKQKAINLNLEKIEFVKAVLTLNTKDLNTLNTLKQTLEDKALYGSVIFNTNLDAEIRISSLKSDIRASQAVELKEGKYTYIISAKHKCPVEGKFEIKRGELTTINKDVANYPKITLKSNMPSSELKISLNGKNMVLNQAKTIEKCSGDIVWSVEYDNQKKDGLISLEPNLEKIVEAEFISTADYKKIKEKVDYFTNSKEININFGYSINSEEDSPSIKRAEISYFKNSGIYKFGTTLAIGTPNEFIANDINTIEVLADFRVQFHEIFDKTISISTVPMIPYVGVSAGVDLYDITSTDKETKYLFRGVLGFNILLNKQFGLNFNYERDFADKTDNVFNAGIVLAF